MPVMSAMLAPCVLALASSFTHAQGTSSSTAAGGSTVSTFTYPECALYLESVAYSDSAVLSDTSCTNPRKSFLSLNTTILGPGCIG